MGLLSTIGAASGRAFGFTRSAIATATDAFFNRVTLLLPGNGTNGAQNNTFLDSSTNNFTITRNGNTTQGTFSPFSQTGWSVNLDGTGDYLTVADNAVLDMGGSNFTMEFWTYVTGTPSAYQAFISKRASTGVYGGVELYLTSGRTLNLQATLNGSSWGVDITTTSTINLNEWAHIAVVRNGNVWTVYINGTSGATTTVSGTVPDNSSAFTIGAGAADGGHNMVAAYISNFRLVKGTALYTANFTPSTSALTTTSQGATASEVELLTCQGNRFIDISDNAFAITVNGNPSIQAFSPFAPTAAYSAATVGGSAYFDGTGDYLSLPNNTAFSGIGSDDWTVEAWIYTTAGSTSQTIMSISGNTGAWAAIRFEISGFNSLYLVCSKTGSAWDINYAAGTLPANAWNHVAATRSGTNVRLYINGSQVGVTQTLTGSLLSGAVNRIGIAPNDASFPFVGYISGARYIRGTALYTGTTYTVPTEPFTAITNTQLLCNFTNAGIADATSDNVLETIGNVQISTTQSKWGGSSMYFDGTGDYLTIPNAQQVIGTINTTATFTIECWIYHTQRPAFQESGLIGDMTPNGGTNYWSFGPNQNGYLVWYSFSNATQTATTTQIPLNTWTHIAVSIQNGTIRLFVDGILQAYTGNAALTATSGSLGYLTMGQWNGSTNYAYFGYVDDLRITRGVARYTANFTPPTAAFALQ